MVFDPFHDCAFRERAAPDAYRAGEVARSYHSYRVYQRFNLTETKAFESEVLIEEGK